MANLQVGFIGMGIMGRPMARNLLRAGYPVRVHNRTPSRAEEVAGDGAEVAASPAECARGADVVITNVTDGPDVEAVILGPGGAAEGAAEGTTFIDMSTISPEIARSIASRLAARGMPFLDAPVTGGDVGARNGTLTIMVGGDRETFERVRPLLSAMGRRIVHMGPSGAGQVTKASNQILCALNLLGVCEALAFAHRSGIDLRRMLEAVSGGAANSWALENLGPKIVAGDFEPAFRLKLIQKDLRIVLGEAAAVGLPLAGTALCHQYFRSGEAWGEGELGTQAMFKVLERLGAFRLEPSPPPDRETPA